MKLPWSLDYCACVKHDEKKNFSKMFPPNLDLSKPQI